MGRNIISVDLGEVSAASSQVISGITDRLDSAENRIDTLETQTAGIDAKIASSLTNEDTIEKIRVATGIRLGNFVPGTYDLTDDTDGITTIRYSARWKCARVPCKPDDTVRIRTSIGTGYKAYAFIGSDGLRIGDAKGPGSYTGSTVTAPAGAAAILVNCGPTLQDPYVAVGDYIATPDVDVIIDEANLSPAAMTPMTSEIDTSANIPTSNAVKTYVDGQVGDLAGIGLSTEITEQSHPTDAVPTSNAVYNFVNSEMSSIGTAASKTAVTQIVNSNDDQVPTAKAVVNYVSSIRTAINNSLGTAATKDTTGSISSTISPVDRLPTESAVRSFVESKTSGIEYNAKTYTDGQVSIINGQLTNLANDMSDITYDISQLGDAASKDITLQVNTSYDLPTSNAVKTYVDNAISNTSESISETTDDLDERVSDLETGLSQAIGQIYNMTEQKNDPDRFTADVSAEINGNIASRKRQGTLTSLNTHWNLQNGQHICFQIHDEGVPVVIEAGSSATMYAFVSVYTELYITLCQNESVHSLNIGTTVDTIVPTGAKYLIVNCTRTEYSDGPALDQTPKSVKINGVEMLYGVRERVGSMREGFIGARSSRGALGKDDWKLEIDGMTLKRENNLIKASGVYRGESKLYVRITDDLDYNTTPPTFNVINNMAKDVWPLTYGRYDGQKLQLQSCKHMHTFVSPEYLTINFNPPVFTCYDAMGRDLMTRSSDDESVAYNENYIYSGSYTPWLIVMSIEPGTNFGGDLGEGETAFSVWLEDMTSVSAAKTVADDAMFLGAQNQVMIGTISSDATYLEHGLMSAEDKYKLDRFLDPSYYVTKFDDSPLYIYKGIVATINDLPSEPSTSDAYYVESAEATYVFNGEEWDNHGASVVVSAITSSEIDSLF